MGATHFNRSARRVRDCATLTSFHARSLLVDRRKTARVAKSHQMEHRMSSKFRLFWLATASAVCLGTPAVAQDTVKIGELNSYKSQPAFLEPYKRGWELAVEEINAKGGVLGKKLEVISR
jgi:ABC-type branched-subunit amino acid transport system substrate-binding protein